MGQICAISFINKIYDEMRTNDSTMSLTYVKIKYEMTFLKEVATDYIQTLLVDDERFVFINRNQFILKDKLIELMNKYNSDLSQVEQAIKNQYFVRNIERKSLLKVRQEKLRLKFGEKVYKIYDIDSFYDSVRKEGFISYNMTKIVAESLDKNYYVLLEEMDKMGVRIDHDNKFRKKCSVIGHYHDRESVLPISAKPDMESYQRESIEIRDNGKNILLLDFLSKELIAALIFLHLMEQGYLKEGKFLTYKHINELYKMNIIERPKRKREIKMTNIGRKLIEGLGQALKERAYSLERLAKEVYQYNTSVDFSKSQFVKELDDTSLWKNIAWCLDQIYKHNMYSKLLVKLIGTGNKNGKYTLGDIFIYNLMYGQREDIFKVFVAERATSGIRAIRENNDICLKCNGYRCSRNLIISQTKLLHYRFNYVDDYIGRVQKDLTILDKVLKDPLIIKFILPHNLTLENKIIMRKASVLSPTSNVLDKEVGEYCPFRDNWILKENYDDKMVHTM